MTRFRALFAFVALAALGTGLGACAKPPGDPMQLDGGLLTVDNRSGDEWKDVEIWLNTYYRVTARSIPPHSRMQARLDDFIAGFGQRFNYRKTMITDLRLTAKLPDGRPFELKKQFEVHGLNALTPQEGSR